MSYEKKVFDYKEKLLLTQPDPENKEQYNAWVETVRQEDIESEKENYEVRESGIEGKGWYARHDFQQGETISHYLVGKYEDLRSDDQMEEGSAFEHSAIQAGISPDGKALYVGVPNHLRQYINHSCEPNAGIRRQARSEGGWDSELIAIHTIRTGDEIVIDYSTTQLEKWSMDECRCGASLCRHTVTDFAQLDRNLQENYIKLGIVPDWMIEVVRPELSPKAKE